MTRKTAEERYSEKVDKRGPNDCWVWMAARFDKGYGAFRLGEKQLKAHRFGYELANGPIPAGMIVCHVCDNPPCQNPKHLLLGSHRDNAIDRERKGRGFTKQMGPIVWVSKTRARGERHGRAVVSDELVRQIRRRVAAGESQQALADEVGCSQVAISKIVRRLTWTHVTD